MSVEKQPRRGSARLPLIAFVLAFVLLAGCGSKQSNAKPASTACASSTGCLKLVGRIEPHIGVLAPSAAGLVFESGSVAATAMAQPIVTMIYREPTRRLRFRLAVFDRTTVACPPNRIEKNVTSPAGRTVCLATFPKDVDARYVSDGFVYVLSAMPSPTPAAPNWATPGLRSHVLKIVDSYR